jgi:methionyl-tRNA formyltransferase
LLYVLTANIPVHYTPAKSRSLSGWQPPTPFDIGVVVSFGYFITPTILKSLPLGALNVHPSLLPLYRGASPIQYTIMNRDEVGGVTVQELDDKAWDAGRILAQSKVVRKAFVFKQCSTTLTSCLGSRQGATTVIH